MRKVKIRRLKLKRSKNIAEMSIINSEGGRISQLIDSARRCAQQEQLAKAQQYYGADSCVKCKPENRVVKDVITESAYLNSQLANCSFNYYKPPVVPESVRIAAIQQLTISNSTNPLDPTTRFSQYSRVIIPPCPPTDPNIFNGNLPKPAKVCPALPNTPLNPVLPA